MYNISKMDYKIQTAMFLTAALAWSCATDDAPGSFEPHLGVAEATNVMHTEATIHGSIELQGNTPMPELHFAFGTTEAADSMDGIPSMDGYKASLRLTGLVPGTTYYYRLMASNGRVTLRSNTLNFTTKPSGIPAVGEATDITRTGATLHGQATALDDGTMPRLAFLVGTGGSMQPATQPLTINGGDASLKLDSLTPGTTYSYCLEAYDGHNTTRSDTLTFATQPNNRPTLGQPRLYSHGPTSAIVGYDVTDNGGEALTATGLCVTCTADGATTRISVTGDINSDTVFSLRIGSLRQHATYEIRPYAANTVGETTGEPLCLTTGDAVTTTAPGELAYVIGNDMLRLEKLSLAGPLNGDDLRCLRRMMGREADGKPSGGRLAQVDMTEAHIVEGGGGYDNSHFTRNGVVGHGLFALCTGLTALALPDDATTIEKDALQGCTALRQLQIPTAATSVLPSEGCTALEAITVVPTNRAYSSKDGVLFAADGSRIVWFPAGKTGDYTLPSTVTAIGDYAFQGCAISRFTMPDALTEMGQAAFFASGVEEVTLPDGLRLIPTATFQQCSRLHTVRLGSKAELVADYAFDGCPLKHIYIDAPYPPVCNANALTTSYKPLLQSCTLHVPAGRSGMYKANASWGQFKHIVETK